MLHQLIVNVRKPFLKMVPIPTPELYEGEGSLSQVSHLCKKLGITHPLIVTDKTLVELGLVGKVTHDLKDHHVLFTLFDEVLPDPEVAVVRRGVELFKQKSCDGIIAIGGGSPIDCAKAISASAKTGKDITKLFGLLRVHRPIFPIIAIPTTSGTGSETTVASVISDKASRSKLNITDPFIVPKVAILDSTLLMGLPPQITAETGMDALTHAIESYLSGYANQQTREWSISAIRTIFEYLPQAHRNGQNLEARQALAKASFDAGLAFTRTYIGYVHAIAHQLGAFYHVPHGRANAIVLPKVLGVIAQREPRFLAELLAQVFPKKSTGNVDKDAKLLVDMVEKLLVELDLPTVVKELNQTDITALADQAIKEAFGVYPVPVVMTRFECEEILRELVPE
ncbi:iron-containing alcohol dehydrogenase [Vibrio ishigakensis]|nr:iron-containing alcohol dehydrogenase [Vibrio ishigakensis]